MHIGTQNYVGNIMKRLEIIEIRLGRENIKRKTKLLEKVIKEFNEEMGNKSIKIYKNVSIDADFMIQIKHNNDNINWNGSKTGTHLMFTLNDIGLISHSVWKDILP